MGFPDGFKSFSNKCIIMLYPREFTWQTNTSWKVGLFEKVQIARMLIASLVRLKGMRLLKAIRKDLSYRYNSRLDLFMRDIRTGKLCWAGWTGMNEWCFSFPWCFQGQQNDSNKSHISNGYNLNIFWSTLILSLLSPLWIGGPTQATLFPYLPQVASLFKQWISREKEHGWMKEGQE